MPGRALRHRRACVPRVHSECRNAPHARAGIETARRSCLGAGRVGRRNAPHVRAGIETIMSSPSKTRFRQVGMPLMSGRALRQIPTWKQCHECEIAVGMPLMPERALRRLDGLSVLVGHLGVGMPLMPERALRLIPPCQFHRLQRRVGLPLMPERALRPRLELLDVGRDARVGMPLMPGRALRQAEQGHAAQRNRRRRNAPHARAGIETARAGWPLRGPRYA